VQAFQISIRRELNAKRRRRFLLASTLLCNQGREEKSEGIVETGTALCVTGSVIQHYLTESFVFVGNSFAEIRICLESLVIQISQSSKDLRSEIEPFYHAQRIVSWKHSILRSRHMPGEQRLSGQACHLSAIFSSSVILSKRAFNFGSMNEKPAFRRIDCCNHRTHFISSRTI
jgi:hypothetical protein